MTSSTTHQLSDFAYDLPEDLIAQAPADRRDGSRLLVVGREGHIDATFDSIVDRVPADAVIVVNDARVVPARVRAHKVDTGGAVELLVLEPAAETDAGHACMARASKAVRPGAALRLVDGSRVVVVAGRDADGIVRVDFAPALAAGETIVELLDRVGGVPLPPYIRREQSATAEDAARYQTVYAAVPGAVAAPTAGLHFTTALLDRLRARGCAIHTVTLHVGLGTFAPVRVAELDAHRMHAERFSIPPATAAAVASGRPVIAVGTTCVRALEAAASAPRTVRAGAGRTDLFIRPGYEILVVDGLITNFHLPGSTLLMLVCAFGGYAPVMAAYRHAVAARYRFFSYGDAMLVVR